MLNLADVSTPETTYYLIGSYDKDYPNNCAWHADSLLTDYVNSDNKVWTKTQNVPVENSKNCRKRKKNTVSLFSMNFHTADTKALVFVMVLHMHTYGTISKVLLQPNVYGVYSIHAILVQ